MKKHIIKVHDSEKARTCGTCGKVFDRKSHLDKHQRDEKHSVRAASKHVKTDQCKRHCTKELDNAYVCMKCEQSFAQESAMDHHECKPYRCPLCRRSYSDRNRLAIHVCKHYACSICHKEFKDSVSLCKHKTLHYITGKTVYDCEVLFYKLETHSEILKMYTCTLVHFYVIILRMFLK